MKKSLLIYLFFLTTIDLFASYPYVRNFSKNTSNAGNQNWGVVQNENQWMYFANNKGLIEFDGFTWTVYPNKKRTLIRSVYYDKESDRIYVGSYNEYGFYQRNKDGVMAYTMLNNPKKNNIFSDIWNIHKLNNSIVFQADFDLIILEGDLVNVYRFQNKINSSTVINNRLIIAQINKGLSYFDGKKFVEFNDNSILKDKVVRAILPYENNQLLFVTNMYGIYKYDTKKITRFVTDIDTQLKDNQVFCATIKNNILAIGTIQNGLIVKNFTDNTTIFSNKDTGLQNNTVLSLAFDNQNNLWLGLDKGIDYVMINSVVTDLVGNSNNVGAGYTSCIFNNKLYLGSNQGLYFMDYDTSNNQIFKGIKSVPEIKGQIWNLSKIDGKLFCSCDKGLFIISDKGIQKVSNLTGVWRVKPLRSTPNTIIGTEYNEFFVLKKVNGKWLKTNSINGFQEGAKNFFEDSDGKIWLTNNSNDIYRLTINQTYNCFSNLDLYKIDTEKSFSQNIVMVEINNQISLSTEKGIFYFNKQENKFKLDKLLNIIFKNPISPANINADVNGNIWSVNSRKIMFASKLYNNKYTVDSASFFLLKDKLIGDFEHINFLSPSVTLIATENGFSIIDLSKSTFKSEQSKLAFRAIYITTPKDSIVKGYFKYQEQNEFPKFKFKNNSLRFEFISNEYRGENLIYYSFILENYDKLWSEFSSKNTKEYSKIPPGSYIFKIRALNLTDLKTTTTQYKFKILPPWYKSIFANVIYILLIIVAVYLLIKYIQYKTAQAERTMEIKKEQEIKEQEKQFILETKEKEKEIIALKNRQLEHNLRHKSQDLANSTMTVIRKNEILLDMSEHLKKINEQLIQNIERKNISKEIAAIQKEIDSNIDTDNNWIKFQENFDLVYENYLTRLGSTYPHLTHNDKKICAYLRMNLSSKDIAPLVNTTFQSVEMTRHRLRKKLQLDRSINLTDFLQNF